MREIEDALAAWREAVRRLDDATDGDVEVLAAEVEEHRQRFQDRSARYMIERIDALKEAELRRKTETPSTDAFHAAARDEMKIAADIWDTARISDVEVPESRRDRSDGGTSESP
jgi:hypothetical protein